MNVSAVVVAHRTVKVNEEGADEMTGRRRR